jgi:DNA topoisomerase-3
MAYVCEKAVGAGKTCDFRSGKVILQQEVARGDMQKLLSTGKTELLKGFISNKTRRKFSAYLVRDPATGKVGFEFEPRNPKTAPKAGTKPTAGKSAAAKPEKTKAAAPAGAGDAVNEPVLKKAAARKPVAKKSAVKKSAAKKPAVKKAG